jgi:site-specific recombinase XerD
MLLIFTACRRSEVCNATMNDIVILNNQLWLKVIGKGSKYGEIPILPELERYLNEYRVFYGLCEIRKRTQIENEIPLIIRKLKNGNFKAITAPHLYLLIKKLSNQVANKYAKNHELYQKFKNFSPHWLRYSSATFQINAGIDIRIVQKNLRHESIETTMRYQHVEKTKQFNETVDKFKL